jgi:hypothetical protein
MVRGVSLIRRKISWEDENEPPINCRADKNNPRIKIGLYFLNLIILPHFFYNKI